MRVKCALESVLHPRSPAAEGDDARRLITRGFRTPRVSHQRRVLSSCQRYIIVVS